MPLACPPGGAILTNEKYEKYENSPSMR
ncbi:MAG: hypothetical protein JWO94_2215, partial [Verrucomicrobiaceae bacterium]|nr:hypothetical protein [Verrucomicrobiaceae bacterium]